ncbi:MAG: hypothetical protein O7C75_15935 [Verrucomicrobia bacterium]|nr:hypothetical protein [Verrucomicrobiota bacterium]
MLPKNKKLTQRELINLFRYHYWQTWEKEYSRNDARFSTWPKQRELHLKLLANFKSLLVRYGFHGYGNPKDDNGMAVFAEDRLVLQEVVAEIPSPFYSTSVRDDFAQFENLEEVKEFFRNQGSPRAKKLVKQVSAAVAK